MPEEHILLKFDRLHSKGNKSKADIVASFTDEERIAFFEAAEYTDEDFERLEYDSDFWLRPKQIVPIGGDAPYITALVAGRGFG